MQRDPIVFTGFWRLYLGRTFLTLPAHIVGLFLPIFLFVLFGEELWPVFVYYVLGHLAYALCVPLGARFLNSAGYPHSIALATLFNTLFFGSLMVAHVAGSMPHALLAVGCSLVALVFFRTLYWMPYHVEVAKLTMGSHRGFAISLILTMVTLATVVGPALGGFIISAYGYGMVFLVVACTSCAAYIPFRLVPSPHERFEWSYSETWRMLRSPTYRGMVQAMFAHGVESVVGIVAWPLFIYLLLDGNVLEVGMLSSVIVAMTILLQLLAGRHLDRIRGPGNMLHVSSVLTALGWVAKAFVATAFQVFVAGVYHGFAKLFTNTSIDTMYYDLAADSGHYIDEVTVLREMAIQLGKVFALMCMLALIFVVSVQWTFFLAAVAAFFLNALYREHQPERRMVGGR